MTDWAGFTMALIAVSDLKALSWLSAWARAARTRHKDRRIVVGAGTAILAATDRCGGHSTIPYPPACRPALAEPVEFTQSS